MAVRMHVIRDSEVVADLDDRLNSRIAVRFPYDRDDIKAIKRIPGRKFVGKDDLGPKGEPYWTVPRDMISARALRTEFGKRLKLTDRLVEWGDGQVKNDRLLGSLGAADDAELEVAPDVLPELADRARGYQKAGIKFLSINGGLIADQPGLGKTIQVIGAVAERGLMDDSNRAFLTIASPALSVATTWKRELSRWQPFPAFFALGSRDQRQAVIQEFLEHIEFGGTGWLVVNPDMARYGRTYDTTDCILHDEDSTNADSKGCDYCQMLEYREYPELEEVTWDVVAIDESHESIRNPKTLTARGIYDLNYSEACLKMSMTGTPIMNRVIDLWSVLHWHDPVAFKSKWRWAERFCEIEENDYGKTIGDLSDDPAKQNEFFESLKPYVLRRTKGEVASELPPKNHMHVALDFSSKKHENQYRQFEAEAYLKIAEFELTATGVLDELTRLRQFSIAYCDVTENPKGPDHPLVVQHTDDSKKVEWLDEQLHELGILYQGKPNGGDEKIVVFSQFVSVVKMVKQHYEDKGCRVGEISGRVSMKKREEEVTEFQDPDSDMKIMVVSTKAGGASIELDAADTCVFMDETWSHARMEQAEDRLHRANKGREVPVNIYVLRTEGTVETDHIMPKVRSKKAVSDFILDVRRGVHES